MEEKIWSDHLPIRLSLNFNGNFNTKKKLNLLPKLKWKGITGEHYKIKLDKNLRPITKQKDEINLKDLGAIIKEAASIQPRAGKQISFKSKWFDGQCRAAREKSFKALKIFRKTENP